MKHSNNKEHSTIAPFYTWTSQQLVMPCDFTLRKKGKAKSFPSHKAQRVALTSVYLALTQTTVYTARPWIRG